MTAIGCSSADAGAYSNVGFGYGDGMTVTYLDPTEGSYATLKVEFDEIPAEDIQLTMDSVAYAPIPVSYMSGNLLDIYINRLTLGNHTLTVESGDYSSSAVIEVKAYVAVTSVAIDKASADIYVGQSMILQATVTPELSSFPEVTWISSNPGIATVEGGIVVGVSAGSAVITAMAEGKTADCIVKVSSSKIIDEKIEEDGSVTVTESDTVSGEVKVTNTLETVEKDGALKTKVTETLKDKNGNTVYTENSTTLSKDGTETTASERTDSSGTVKETVSSVVAATVIESGASKTTVSESSVETSMSQIGTLKQQTGIEKNTLVIKTDSTQPVSKAVVNISNASVSKIGSDKDVEVKIETGKGTIVLENSVLSGLSGKTGNISISVGDVDKSKDLNEKQRAAVGDNPVFDLALYAGSESIHQLGGKATITVPYTLKAGEDPSKVTVWYVNDEGVLSKADSTVYDAESKTVTFTTSHFSVYTIGIESTAPSSGSDNTVLIVVICIVVILVICAGAGFYFYKKKKSQ